MAFGFWLHHKRNYLELRHNGVMECPDNGKWVSPDGKGLWTILFGTPRIPEHLEGVQVKVQICTKDGRDIEFDADKHDTFSDILQDIIEKHEIAREDIADVKFDGQFCFI